MCCRPLIQRCHCEASSGLAFKEAAIPIIGVSNTCWASQMVRKCREGSRLPGNLSRARCVHLAEGLGAKARPWRNGKSVEIVQTLNATERSRGCCWVRWTHLSLQTDGLIEAGVEVFVKEVRIESTPRQEYARNTSNPHLCILRTKVVRNMSFRE